MDSLTSHLSNTVTPKYFGEFREKVINGDILVCEKISLQMNLIEELIENPLYYHDDRITDAWVAFVEGEMTLTDGSPATVLDTFKLWYEDAFSWFYFAKKTIYVPSNPETGEEGHYENKLIKCRLRHKQYLIVARGAAKTLYQSWVQAYSLIVESDTTHQITVAPTMNQTCEVMNPINTAINRAMGPVIQFLTQGSLQNTTGNIKDRKKLASTKKGIQNFITSSLIEPRPMSTPKLQGLRCKYATVDEWLSCPIKEDPMSALEQSASKLHDWLIIFVSSEGTIRDGAGDSIKFELESILRQEYYAPMVSIWWYQLDSVEEVGHPKYWQKAQPNIGYTVSYETYQDEIERAEHNPTTRNDMLAKRFGIPTEGYTYYFTYEETRCYKPREYWQMECSMGCDLSRGDDFCAFTFLFPLNGDYYGIKTRCYITERTLRTLPELLRYKYNDFIDEGSLIVMPGTTLDMMDVYDDLNDYIDECQYSITSVGYDPYNAEEFIKRWIAEHSQWGVEKVIQGKRTESVPLGEIKKLSEDRKIFFDQELHCFCMEHAVAAKDNNGNMMLMKLRNEEKIDSVAALLDAYIAYKRNTQRF